MTSSRILARNSALNVAGQIVPVVIALVTIPMLLRRFGPERFGVLTLVWAAIGYFGLFELGIGRALTQAVARRLGSSDEREIGAVVRAGLAMLAGLGALAGLAVLACANPLATRVLDIPQSLQREATASFRILGAALPFVLATAGLRGVMEAHQHFGLTTVLRIPAALFSYAGPLLTLPFAPSLVPAVGIIAAGRVLMCVAHAVACVYWYPELRSRGERAVGAARGLLQFGAWSTVSNIISPIMVYMDRFVVGATLGLAAVTAYVTPYEGISKLLIIPGALTGVMLPALASVANTPPRMRELYERTLRGIALVMFPPVLVAITLAREGLALWAGGVLPADSATVLQWLSVGMFVSALAHAPAAALQSVGRPDVIARVHLAELPVYALLVVTMLSVFGLPGIAMAWAARAALDAIALAWVARRMLGLALLPRVNPWALAAMPVLLVTAALLPTAGARLLFVGSAGSAYIVVAWRAFLTPAERVKLRAWIVGAVGRVAPIR